MKQPVELEDLEIGVITSALNSFWNEAHEQLTEGGVMMGDGTKRPLGDIEKRLLEQRKELVLPILRKFENL
jgi:hypothetical protein